MDSLADRVELAAKGGPAGEIKIRESLSKALEEAGVEVSEGSFLGFQERPAYPKPCSISTNSYSMDTKIVDPRKYPRKWAGNASQENNRVSGGSECD